MPDRRPPVLLLWSGPFCPLHSADSRAKILQALTADCRCSSALTDKWVLMLADLSSHCWQQSKPAASPEGALQQAVMALAKAHACCCLICNTMGTQLPVFQLEPECTGPHDLQCARTIALTSMCSPGLLPRLVNLRPFQGCCCLGGCVV